MAVGNEVREPGVVEHHRVDPLGRLGVLAKIPLKTRIAESHQRRVARDPQVTALRRRVGDPAVDAEIVAAGVGKLVGEGLKRQAAATGHGDGAFAREGKPMKNHSGRSDEVRWNRTVTRARGTS
jgi:hypothetical protein